MARKKHSTLSDEVFDLLKLTPIWVGPFLAAVTFVVVRYGMPALMPPKQNGPDVGIILRGAFPMLSWPAAAIVLMAWVAAEVQKFRDRRMLDRQRGIESIRMLSWSEFERLIGEYYRRQGYLAEVVGSPSGDGGVDVELRGRGELVLVQAKQWKAYKVGVKPVRELLGVVTSQRASRGIVVTSGRFTQEARRFATQAGNLEIVEGDDFAAMIRSVQPAARHLPSPGSPRVASSSPATTAAPACPTCGAVMVLRTARRGQNAGSTFWGAQPIRDAVGKWPNLERR